MPQINNTELLGTILKSTLGVIGRRTSEAYANMTLESVLSNISKKHKFLRNIKIEKDRYKETINVIDIDDEINNENVKNVGIAIKDFMINIANTMGKDAGFYFIKEIKEDIPYKYENIMSDLGIDLDYIQSEFITEIKNSFKFSIENSEVMNHVLTVLFEIVDSESGRDVAYETLDELINRLNTQYEALNYVKINDVRSIQNVELINTDKQINKLDSQEVGVCIQKIIQELSMDFDEKKFLLIMDKIKNNISADYSYKLNEMGVNFDVIKLKQTLLLKHTIQSLLQILAESTTQSYSVMILSNIINKYEDKFDFLKLINIDALHLSDGIEAIEVSDEINNVSPSELGRAIQRMMEKVSTSLGEKAGRDFLDLFKKRMGKAYILRLEEIGVNLHMIELRKNLL